MTGLDKNNSFSNKNSSQELIQKYKSEMLNIYKTGKNSDAILNKIKIAEKFQEINPDDNIDYGFLQVEVTSKKGTVPIENAHIVVMNDDNKKNVQKFLITDKNGLTQFIILSAIPKSEVASNAKPYLSYNIIVSAENFYQVEKLHIPVFSNKKTIQAVDLTPIIEQ